MTKSEADYLYDFIVSRKCCPILKLNPAVSMTAALQKIEPIIKKFSPDQPFEYNFVEEEYAKKFGDEERIGKLAGFFASLAVVISCLGLFGINVFCC